MIYTHEGTLTLHYLGKSSTLRTALRETKHHWITPDGFKYRKGCGTRPHDAFARRVLDLSTVKPLVADDVQ